MVTRYIQRSSEPPTVVNPDATARAWALAELGGWTSYLTALGRAPGTVSAYSATAGAFATFLVAERDLTTWANVTRSDVRAFLYARAATGIAPRTANREGAALRSFARYLVWGGALDGSAASPIGQVKPAATASRLPTYLTRGEVLRLLDQPDVTTAVGLRDRAVLEMLYASGLRVAELCGLRILDYRAGERSMIVMGKGRVERVAFYGREADAWIARYLADARPVLCGWRSAVGLRGQRVRYRLSALAEAAPTAALFVGRLGGRGVGRRTVERLVSGYARAAGIVKTVTPHTMRHTFATHLYEGGAELRHLQLLLGHERVTTTAIYTHVSPARLRASYDAAHPHGAGERTPELDIDRRRNWIREGG